MVLLNEYLVTLLLGISIGFAYRHKLILLIIMLLSFVTGVSLFTVNVSEIFTIVASIYSNLTAENIVFHAIAFAIGFYIGTRTQKEKEREKIYIVRRPIKDQDY